MTNDSILELLKQVPYPGFSRDIVSFGLVKDVSYEDGIVSVAISVQTNDASVPEQIFKNCHAILDPLPEVKHARIEPMGYGERPISHFLLLSSLRPRCTGIKSAASTRVL